MKNKIIFITGGSASGKTIIAKILNEALGEKSILISQDMFYKTTLNSNTNYDIPEAFDWDKQIKFIRNLKNKKSAIMPIYDFTKHAIVGENEIKSKEIIIFEGLFSFWNKDLVKLSDFQVFVDAPSDTRLARRLLRDIKDRNRKAEDVIERWINDVQPSYKKYISIMKSKADIIIPWEKVSRKSIKALISIIKGI